MPHTDSFGTARTLDTGGGPGAASISLPALEAAGYPGLSPACRTPSRSCWRTCCGGRTAASSAPATSRRWRAGRPGTHTEIAFMPARVLLQDFTGVPAVVDLAAMRDGIARLGGDPEAVNPSQPAELVIDHSVQVDHFGRPDAFDLNAQLEFARNRERYAFLKWGQEAFRNFRVVPPDTGIVHQVNIEYLARVVCRDEANGAPTAYPDTLVGTDSHTTMVNGLGVVGWGVGGIEAEAAMLGQPISMLIPDVIGFRLVGGAARRDHRHRPRADHHGTAAPVRRGRKVRGVLRPRAGVSDAGRPGDAGEHVARVRLDRGDLSHRRHDAGLPAADRPRRGAGRAGRGVREEPGACSLPPRRSRSTRT